MWVTFTVLEACIIFGGITIAVLANRLADRAFMRRCIRELDQEYEKLTAASRRNV